MPDDISRLPDELSPHKMISRGGELQLKAEVAVVKYITKVLYVWGQIFCYVQL